MDIFNLIPLAYAKFIIFILAFTRISALFAVFILFRRDMVNAKIVIALAAVLSLYVLFSAAEIQFKYDVVSVSMASHMLVESLIGFMAGLILNLVFEVFSAFGQVASMQIGLGMASLIDPRFGNITMLTQFYNYSIMLIFLLMNGHLFVVKTIVDSFTSIPVGHVFMSTAMLHDVLNYSGIIFSGAIMLSITLVVAIILTNFAISIMSKFAPQFNLFSIGVNMTLVIGLIIIYMTFNIFVDNAVMVLQQGMEFLKLHLRT
jgi:flagellar biosynthesis protein FliR